MRRSLELDRFPILAALLIVLFLGLVSRFAVPRVARAAEGAATLTVRVTGARNAKGKIRAALFRDARGFPSDASKASQTGEADIDPQSLSVQIVFSDLKQGVYAVSVFHDENSNGKLDKNFMGLPKEGYGASNNPKKKMGPPNFEEAKFELTAAQQVLEIKLIY